MGKEELEILIPSETVRKYVMETGWTFTDREKAALLYHENRQWKKKCALLQVLADKTDDEELREQITEWLEWHEKADGGEIPDIIPSNHNRNDHFSEMYVELPNPFERGDIVKTRWGFYGVVGMSSKHWKERVAQKKQMIRGGYSIGYGEANIGVDIFDEETGFLCPTDSISPLDLERYEPKWAEGIMERLLLVAEHIYRNDGYIGDYFYWLERYQDAVKNR